MNRTTLNWGRLGAVMLGCLATCLVTGNAAAQATVPAGETTAAPATTEVTAPAAPIPAAPVTPAAQPAPTTPSATSAPSEVTPGDVSRNPDAASGAVEPVAVPAPAAPAPAAAAPRRYAMPRVIGAVAAEPEPTVPPKTVFPWAIFLDVSPLWQTSAAYDLFSSTDISTRIGLSAERDLVKPIRETTVSVGLAWSTEQAASDVFEDSVTVLPTELSIHNFAAAGRWRMDWLPVLSTYVAAQAGVSRISSKVGWGARVVDWLPMGQLGGGVTAQLPRAGKIQPGLLAEGGYFLSGSTKLRFEGNDAEFSSLEYLSTELGSFKRSGPYLRFSAFIRY